MPIYIDKTDAYLVQAFSNTRDVDNWSGESAADSSQPALPMLVRVDKSETWTPPEGFQLQSRVGDVVSGRGTAGALLRLQRDPAVLSIEASRSVGGARETASSLPFVNASAVHRPPIDEQGDGALVAVIDAGIDVLHAAFLDDNGASRIVEIWDQTDNSGQGPAIFYPELHTTYGTVYRSSDIATMVQSGRMPAGLQRGHAHGTHVASIAAGRAVASFAGGMAPAARIVVVVTKIDADPTDPFSIGYSASHVDALAYVKVVAKAFNLPVAVNVSQGMNAGAHDGTSLLEAAFDAFTGEGRLPGAAIVKSAGNERACAGHARLTMASRSVDELRWSSQAIFRGEDVCELWFKACDEYTFRLRDPNGEWSSPASWNNILASQTYQTGNRCVLFYTRYHHDNGDSRLLITVQCNDAGAITPGDWLLEIVAGDVRSNGEIHAWVERHNARPVFFLNHLNEEMTVSIPGTAHTVITVGAVTSAFPVRMQSFSSFGPTRDRREKPDLVAPGVGIDAAAKGTGTGTRADSGTSMAAPHVTGAIALLFSHLAKQPGATQPNAAQVRAVLTQHAQNFSGHHTVSNGYGLLDAEALLRAFM